MKQIKQIENLVNEFSDFARMPKPLIKNNDLIKVLEENIELLKKIDSSINFKVNNKTEKKVLINFDNEQFNRLFFNLIKNSIESIIEKVKKSNKSLTNIVIEINQRRDYITVNLTDTGEGLKNKTKDIIKPYYTTKKKELA